MDCVVFFGDPICQIFCFRADQFIHREWLGPGLAAADSHAHQEVPPQPEGLEGPDGSDPASCSLCDDRYGSRLHQERHAALSEAGAQPCTLQHRTKLLFLQVGQNP